MRKSSDLFAEGFLVGGEGKMSGYLLQQKIFLRCLVRGLWEELKSLGREGGVWTC